MTDLVSAWIETSYSSLPVAPGHQPHAEGKQRRLNLPGWKEKCEPLRKDAKFWYAVWVSGGKPNTGELHRTRNQLRVAIECHKGVKVKVVKWC